MGNIELFIISYHISALTDSFLASQVFVFFAAGFETSSTTMSHILYELALNHKIQDKLREEINEEYKKHGSNLTYENIKNMPYLTKVFKGTSFEKEFTQIILLLRVAIQFI